MEKKKRGESRIVQKEKLGYKATSTKLQLIPWADLSLEWPVELCKVAGKGQAFVSPH